jgi:hypothetical protein
VRGFTFVIAGGEGWGLKFTAVDVSRKFLLATVLNR